MSYPLNNHQTVVALGKMFPSDETIRVSVIPHTWYRTVVKELGWGNQYYVGVTHAPHLVAIMILSEIVYWYRPAKDGGKKFAADKLQKQHYEFMKKFGISKLQSREALKFLEEELGVITVEHRDVVINERQYPNRQYIGLNVEVLERLTFPQTNTLEEDMNEEQMIEYLMQRTGYDERTVRAIAEQERHMTIEEYYQEVVA